MNIKNINSSINRMQTALVFIAVVCACSAFAANPGPQIEKTADVTPAMLARAGQLRTALKITEGPNSSGIFVNVTSIRDYLAAPEKLAARIALLGFTNIYLSLYPGNNKAEGEQLLQWRKAFIRAAHAHGLRVYAETLKSHAIFVSDDPVAADCAGVLEYNKSVAPEERLHGIAACLAPNQLKRTFARRPEGLTLAWDSGKNITKGGDNDLLLKRATDALALARKTIEPLSLRHLTNPGYQPLYDAGKVANGGALQFLESCETLIVEAYGRDKAKIWNKAEPLLKAARGKPDSVSICIKTAQNAGGGKPDPASMQPVGWDHMIDAIKFLTDKGAMEKAFLGVDVFRYEALEKMWDGTRDGR